MSKKHYVNNTDFLNAMVQYQNDVKEAFDAGLPKPQVPNYVGECILRIATNLTQKPNFYNYPFKEEMIGDGIENCLLYIENFDVTKSSNPFAYFTQIIYFAFLRRIIREKKQMYVKNKMLASSSLHIHELQDHDADDEFVNSFIEYMNAFNNFDGSMFEKKFKEKIKKYTGASLEEFYNGEQLEHSLQDSKE